MLSRNVLAWIAYRCAEGRRCNEIISDDGKTVLYQEDQSLCKKISKRPWGGIPIVISSGDCFQLSSIGRSIIDMSSEGKENSADKIGKLIFDDFLSPPDKMEGVGVTAVLYEVMRQSDENFLSFLHNVRYGMVTEENVDFILSRCMENFSKEEQDKIDSNSIHLCPTWKMTQKITLNYLKSFQKPVAVIRPILLTSRNNKKNCCVKEKSYPMLTAITVGATVMLLKNFVVELNIMNGSVGTVTDIVYKEKEGPREKNNLPPYVVVDFPKCLILKEDMCK